MGLINADQVTSCMQGYRLLWILGRFGGGKTSVAYQLSIPFLERGYRLISNNYCVWSDKMEDVKLDKNGHLKCIVILDEGGQYVTAGIQVKMVMAYAAKMDIILIIPSYFPPAPAAQVVTVQPLFNFRSTGIPLTVYRWAVKNGSFKDNGKFIWWSPKSVYGIYSRQDPGDKAGEIMDWLVSKAEEYRTMHGRANNNLSTMESVGEVDRMEDVVSTLAQAADTLSSVSIRRHRR